MKSVYFGVILSIVLSDGVNAAPKLPASVPVCKRKDPNVNECVRKAIETSLSVMSKGIPELGIESLDPLSIDHIDIDKKKNDGRPVDIDLTFKDVIIEGTSNTEITSAVADWDNMMVSFEAQMKGPLVLKGRYITDGIILILPIKGEGPFLTSIEGLKCHIKVHGKMAERGGQKYMDVDRLAWTFDAQHMTSKYENLFEGQSEMADNMNMFLNDNWRDIMTEMTPAIEAAFSTHFQTMAERVFNQIPIDSIALP